MSESVIPVMPAAERANRARMAMVTLGRQAQVVPLGEYQFQLVTPGEDANHLLHLFLTLITCGVWGIMWIILSMRQTAEWRRVVTVDQYGGVWIDQWLWWPPPSVQ